MLHPFTQLRFDRWWHFHSRHLVPVDAFGRCCCGGLIWVHVALAQLEAALARCLILQGSSISVIGVDAGWGSRDVALLKAAHTVGDKTYMVQYSFSGCILLGSSVQKSPHHSLCHQVLWSFGHCFALSPAAVCVYLDDDLLLSGCHCNRHLIAW